MKWQHESRYFLDLRFDEANERCFQKARPFFLCVNTLLYPKVRYFTCFRQPPKSLALSHISPLWRQRLTIFETLDPVSPFFSRHYHAGRRWLDGSMALFECQGPDMILSQTALPFSRFLAGFKDLHAGISSSLLLARPVSFSSLGDK